MSNDTEEIHRLKAEVADLQQSLKTALIQFAATHNLALALAYQCNSPEVLTLNFDEIARDNEGRMLNTTWSEAELAKLASIHEAVRKQLPASRK